MLRSPTTVSSVARVYEQCATGAMIAHCWSATSGFAFFRTWLYIARFGPTDTSYHDMNQRPGTFSGMLSCQSPPLYHAGSFGSRWIIRPPVATGMASAKIPRGPSTFFKMSCTGRCQSAFDQSTGGRRRAQADHLVAPVRIGCGGVGGQNCPTPVLLPL